MLEGLDNVFSLLIVQVNPLARVKMLAALEDSHNLLILSHRHEVFILILGLLRLLWCAWLSGLASSLPILLLLLHLLLLLLFNFHVLLDGIRPL